MPAIKFRGVDFIDFDTLLNDDERLVRERVAQFASQVKRRISGALTEELDGYDELVIEDDRDVTLADLGIEQHPHFTYRYDFDEGWQVDIATEQHSALKKGQAYPRCIAGERAGPPEDCGGLEAHQDMLACIKEPDTDLGREWLEWLGPDYDPNAFNLDKINTALRKLGK